MMEKLRKKLEQASGHAASFTWLIRMDYQIQGVYGSADWGFKKYQKNFHDLENIGDMMGAHPHAFKLQKDGKSWLIDHGTPETVEKNTLLSFDVFSRCFGYDAKASKFGDRWMSTHTAELMESLGCEYDFTVESGHSQAERLHPKGNYNGLIPGYDFAPRYPYFSQSNDISQEDKTKRVGLRHFPVSTGWIDPKHYGWFHKMVFKKRFPERTHGAQFTLNIAAPIKIFKEIVHQCMNIYDDKQLCIAARSDSYSNPRHQYRIKKNVDFLLHELKGNEFQFMRPDTAVELLKNG